MAAADDVKLAEQFVKEVLKVLATTGLVAPQHLAGTRTSMIEMLVATCCVAVGSRLKRSFQTADDVSAAKRLKASNVADRLLVKKVFLLSRVKTQSLTRTWSALLSPVMRVRRCSTSEADVFGHRFLRFRSGAVVISFCHLVKN